jgi:long-chain acyl-CoA synthetase
MNSPAEGWVDKEVSQPSVLRGVTYPPLLSLTLGDLLDQQCQSRGDSECLVFPSSVTRWTYEDLQKESIQIARGLLSLGLRDGDRIGILAGNCPEYLSIFFAAGYIGCILVVLNNTYTTQEAENALGHSGIPALCNQLCKVSNDFQAVECCSLFQNSSGRILSHS